MIRFFSAILLTFCLAPAILSEEKYDRDSDGEKPEVFAKNLRLLVAEMKKAKKVVVYEGLPHQTFERKLLDKELKAKKIVKLHGFPFYAEAITPKDEVAKELKALCEDSKTFSRYLGPKRCGGFHPDWCIELQNGDQKVQILVCFGCSEARVYGSKNDVFAELGEGAKKLVDVLKPLQKNRPKGKDKE